MTDETLVSELLKKLGEEHAYRTGHMQAEKAGICDVCLLMKTWMRLIAAAYRQAAVIAGAEGEHRDRATAEFIAARLRREAEKSLSLV